MSHPHDLSAERAVLGACLFPDELKAVQLAVSSLKPADFYKPEHQSIFTAVSHLVVQGSPVDVVTVADELGQHGRLERLGGRDVLSDLAESLPTAANVEYYIEIIVGHSERRAVIQRLARAAASLATADSSPEGVLNQLNEDLGGDLRRRSVSTTAVRAFSEILPEQVTWLWHGRVPMGMVTVLEGDPGLGKSTLTLDLAARLTRGDPMPDCFPSPGPRGVLLISAEDDAACVIRPRLDVLGADCELVYEMTLPTSDPRVRRLPALPIDLAEIGSVIEMHDIGMVIVDPLMAILDSEVNSHRDQDIRTALAPLAAMAGRTGCAVLLVRHLNKGGGAKAIYRGGGSIGISGAARSVLLVGKHPEDDERRVLCSVKCNLAAPADSLLFRLDTRIGAEHAHLVWEGVTELSADELVASPSTGGKSSPRGDAEEFLLGALSGGPVLAADLEARAKQEGIAERTLKRAKKDLNVESTKVGAPGERGAWMWELPEGGHSNPKGATSGSGPLRGNVAPFGSDGSNSPETPKRIRRVL